MVTVKRLGFGLTQQGLLIAGVPLAFEIVFIAILTRLLTLAEADIEREAHLRLLSAQTNALVLAAYDSKTALGVYAITRQPSDGQRFESRRQSILENAVCVDGMCSHDEQFREAGQRAYLAATQAASAFELVRNRLDNDFKVTRSGQYDPRVARIYSRKVDAFTGRLVEPATLLVKQVNEESRRMSVRRHHSRSVVQWGLVAGVLISLILAVIIALFFSRGFVRRIGVISQNARRLGRGEPLLPSLEGNDEIVELDRVFHDMATELQLAGQALLSSERRVREIVERVPVGIVIVTLEGCVEVVNSTFLRLLDYAGEEVVGRRFDEFLPDASAGERLRLDESAPANAVVSNGQRLAKTKSGESIPVEMLETRFDSVEGTRRLIALQDIRQRRRMEEMKQQFYAMISHDLRAPLTSINLVLASLCDGTDNALSPSERSGIERALRSSMALLALVNDLLEVERLEAGMLPMNFQELEVSLLLDQSLETLADLARDKDVELELSAARSRILGDGPRLHRVIFNLLANAIAVSKPGDTVRIGGSTASDGMYEIHVVDQGPGVPPEKRAQIFERFRQLAGPGETGGSGLGLAIAREIVALHNGTIGVEAAGGGGADFWLRLPVHPGRTDTA